MEQTTYLQTDVTQKCLLLIVIGRQYIFDFKKIKLIKKIACYIERTKDISMFIKLLLKLLQRQLLLAKFKSI